LSRRLGRGLEALIPSLNIDDDDKVLHLTISQLRVNPYQPRKQFDENSIDELAQSIREHGVIQPIIVRRTIKDYEIIAGERRFRASQKCNLETIPAVVKNFTDRQVMEIALIENLQREDLNALEIAFAYQKLIDEFQLTQEELAHKVGKSRPHITNFLRLLQLPEAVQNYVSRGTLSMGHARTLLGLKSEEEIVTLAKQSMQEIWSVRQLEQAIQKWNGAAKKKSVFKKTRQYDPFNQQYEERLREALGTSVKISLKGKEKNKGKIEIDFFSQDDLERILELLQKS
jgi:ParB family chromosome partitioning protein